MIRTLLFGLFLVVLLRWWWSYVRDWFERYQARRQHKPDESVLARSQRTPDDDSAIHGGAALRAGHSPGAASRASGATQQSASNGYYSVGRTAGTSVDRSDAVTATAHSSSPVDAGAAPAGVPGQTSGEQQAQWLGLQQHAREFDEELKQMSALLHKPSTGQGVEHSSGPEWQRLRGDVDLIAREQQQLHASIDNHLEAGSGSAADVEQQKQGLLARRSRLGQACERHGTLSSQAPPATAKGSVKAADRDATGSASPGTAAPSTASPGTVTPGRATSGSGASGTATPDLSSASQPVAAGASGGKSPRKPMFKAPDERDDLKKIKGIGPVMERTLNELGVTTFKQLANFEKKDIEVVEAALQAFPGRIERDDWVGKAKTEYDRKSRA